MVLDPAVSTAGDLGVLRFEIIGHLIVWYQGKSECTALALVASDPEIAAVSGDNGLAKI